jgi:hypothetical protein
MKSMVISESKNNLAYTFRGSQKSCDSKKAFFEVKDKKVSESPSS